MEKILVTLLVVLVLGGECAAQGCLAELEETVNSLTEEVGGLKATVSSLAGQLTAQGERVAFHAKFDREVGRLSRNSIIRMGRVLLNQHNAYNSTTGKFTAPFSGTYFFFGSTKNNAGSGRFVQFEMVVNGEVKDFAGNEAGNAPEIFLSVQAVVNLSAGDKVWMEHHNGQGSYLGSSTDFMGVLVTRSQ